MARAGQLVGGSGDRLDAIQARGKSFEMGIKP